VTGWESLVTGHDAAKEDQDRPRREPHVDLGVQILFGFQLQAPFQ
jgi:hypothetical protein